MPRRASSASPYLTTSVLPLSQLKMWVCCHKVLVEQEELVSSLHQAAGQEQGLVYLPLFTNTATTNTHLHPALMRHSRSAARCFVLHALHPVRPTLGYLSPLPCIHLPEAALALSLRTRRPRAPAEARDAGDGWSREHHVAIHGLLPTQ